MPKICSTGWGSIFFSIRTLSSSLKKKFWPEPLPDGHLLRFEVQLCCVFVHYAATFPQCSVTVQTIPNFNCYGSVKVTSRHVWTWPCYSQVQVDTLKKALSTAERAVAQHAHSCRSFLVFIILFSFVKNMIFTKCHLQQYYAGPKDQKNGPLALIKTLFFRLTA